MAERSKGRRIANKGGSPLVGQRRSDDSARPSAAWLLLALLVATCSDKVPEDPLADLEPDDGVDGSVTPLSDADDDTDIAEDPDDDGLPGDAVFDAPVGDALDADVGDVPADVGDDSGGPDGADLGDDAAATAEVTISVHFARNPEIVAWSAQPAPPVPAGQSLVVRVSASNPEGTPDELRVTAAILDAANAPLTEQALALESNGQHEGTVVAPAEPGAYWLRVSAGNSAGATTDRRPLAVVE